jgi:APA family basic amino acid/polyamine antiporter
MQDPSMKNRLNHRQLKREIGLFSATTVVVANMIGTGIFTTSGLISEELGDPRTMILCWFVGGLFALCGALCYGELGARFPEAGGEYVYLREAFGKWMGFLSGWISLLVGFSAPIAAAAIAFAVYSFRSLSLPPGPKVTLSFFDIDAITLSPEITVAISIIVILSLIHYHSLRVGSRVQNILTLFKVGIIVLFIIAGLVSGQGSVAHFSDRVTIGSGLQGKFAVSLIFVSFAYSGWNAAAYLGGEITEPRRNIPVALFLGTVLVMGLYLLLNAVFIYALSVDAMSGVIDVGAKAAFSLFDNRISVYISGAIACSLLSVLSAMIMAGPRVYYAMSKDGVFFELFAKLSEVRHTPAHSIFLQATIAIVMVITASFDKLLLYIGFTLSLFAMLTVVGMILLRLRQPSVNGQYRAFGYPFTPLAFILGNLWIIYFSVKSRPVPSICGLMTIVFGLIIYFYFHGRKHRSRPVQGVPQ